MSSSRSVGRRLRSEAWAGPPLTLDPELEGEAGLQEAYFPLDYGQIIHQVAVCVSHTPREFTMPCFNILTHTYSWQTSYFCHLWNGEAIHCRQIDGNVTDFQDIVLIKDTSPIMFPHCKISGVIKSFSFNSLTTTFFILNLQHLQQCFSTQSRSSINFKDWKQEEIPVEWWYEPHHLLSRVGVNEGSRSHSNRITNKNHITSHPCKVLTFLQSHSSTLNFIMLCGVDYDLRGK